jgi:hypothetical protein
MHKTSNRKAEIVAMHRRAEPVAVAARVSDLTWPVYTTQRGAEMAADMVAAMDDGYWWPHIRYCERLKGWVVDAIRDSAG